MWSGEEGWEWGRGAGQGAALGWLLCRGGWVRVFEISAPSMAAALRSSRGDRSTISWVREPSLPCFVTARGSLTLSEPLPLSYEAVRTSAPTPGQFGGSVRRCLAQGLAPYG